MNAIAPAPRRREQFGIEDEYGGRRSASGADPEAPIHGKIDASAQARRHEFLYDRIDGCVFTADACTGEKAHRQKDSIVGRKSGGDCRRSVYAERNEKKLAPTISIGESAEQNRADHRAGHVRAGSLADLSRREPKRGGQGQHTAQ